MNNDNGGECKINIFSQTGSQLERYLNPSDINLLPGYQAEVYLYGFDCPVGMLFTETGDLYVAESGYLSGNPRVLLKTENGFTVVAEHFNVPIAGINYLNGNLYVSQRGVISSIKADGTRTDIITGLPSNGDYLNSKVVFGNDGKMYFGQGTRTNSGVVGIDNVWVHTYPSIYDNPGSYIMLNGQNFETDNVLIGESSKESIKTGAFEEFGVANLPFETRKGITRASGSILRANLDGTDLEMYAWGLRNPNYLQFDRSFRLFAANQSYDVRGSRPIANAPDEFQLITQGVWYGWPDYVGVEPVTSSRFKPEGLKQPEMLLTNHPNYPPRPHAIFPANSNVMGFDFNYSKEFGPVGDAYIAEFGSLGPRTPEDYTPFGGIGHKISKIDMITGGVITFAINKSGFPSSISREGGFGWPTDVVFGPDNAMYVLDFGMNASELPTVFIPNTGVLWKFSKI